ncbi:MAG TPA: c-type cytochrome [Opitutaceae bacterium]|nr:c-type cytochrome [Opitutaceae bacterium]
MVSELESGATKLAPYEIFMRSGQLTIATFSFIALASAAFAQGGDRKGDVPQVASELAMKLPRAPVLAPDKQQATFQLPPGFRIDLVAAEPLVFEPVAMCFDGAGNLWVAEMSGYNREVLRDAPALEVKGAAKWPAGKIVKLEDTDGDGRMDRRTVFLDGLDSPRDVAIVRDGVLVADPPFLWLARDTNGDGKADEKRVIAEDFGPKGDGESAANGVLWGRDNWLHNVSIYRYDFRQRNGVWERALIVPRGQFGITQDDFGRLFFNRNSDQLRGDLFAPRYGARNPNVTDLPWVNTLVAKDQTVWPNHPTPGVNRGYRKGEAGQSTGGLRPDASLLEFTAACSPLVYRGMNFPADFYGNAFVCEPAANLIKRNLLHEEAGRITATNAYQGREFVTSTDERFRPVALAETPQGDLYIADLYRGVLQEAPLITTYLRDQALRRGLEAPMFGNGRIWRVRHENGALETKKANLATMPAAELVALLEHPNGWQRDNAQQALVERRERSVAPQLEKLARSAGNERTKTYALWTLEGLGVVAPELLGAALKDASAKVRSATIRLYEEALRGDGAERALAALRPLVRDPQPEVTVQLALSLGEAPEEKGFELMRELVDHGADAFIPKAIACGLAGREVAFAEKLLEKMPSGPALARREATLSILVSAVARSGDAAETARLIGFATDERDLPESTRLAIVDGLESVTRPAVRRMVPAGRMLQASALQSLVTSKSTAVRTRSAQLASTLERFEVDRATAAKQAVTLNRAEEAVYEEGRAVYQLCSACHQPNGMGLPGLAPALVDSRWVNGDPEIMARIVLQGKEGTPGFPSAMPPVQSLNDDQIAAVMTYVRNSWGLHLGAVGPATVRAVRKATTGHFGAWTDAQLLQEMGGAAPKK